MEVDTLDAGIITLDTSKNSFEKPCPITEVGMLRQELADLRNSLPKLIAMQIESYMVRLENDD